MRFRAKAVDIGCIHQFTRIVSTVSKLAKNCILRLNQDKLYFILTERLIEGAISIWCELTQGHFFNEYNIDGVSSEHNEIYLELVPENLVRCLKSAQNAKSIKIKLTKKHVACLTIEVELPTMSALSRVVVHDVPVTVVPRRLWDDYQEPAMPQCGVSIYMPPLKTLRNVVDRMKNLSNFVAISANQSGEMTLKVETDMVTIATHFRDLQHPALNRDETGDAPSQVQNEDRDPSEFAEARVDIRKFSQFLVGQQVNPQRVICNIVDSKVVQFFLIHEDMSLQYFMPALAT